MAPRGAAIALGSVVVAVARPGVASAVVVVVVVVVVEQVEGFAAGHSAIRLYQLSQRQNLQHDKTHSLAASQYNYGLCGRKATLN